MTGYPGIMKVSTRNHLTPHSVLSTFSLRRRENEYGIACMYGKADTDMS